MSSYQWSCLIKDKTSGSAFQSCTAFEVTNHPLKTNILQVAFNYYDESIENLDPLSAAFEGADPLSLFHQNPLPEPEQNIDVYNVDDNLKKSWNCRKVSILNKFTTLEKLSIISSYLPGGEKVIMKQASNVSEHVKHRLEQLDEFEEGSVRKTMGLTQHEYISKINMLNNELVQAWKCEQRVKALKIAIQCSKLLSDTTVMQFYPSKFVIVTDILDTFGNLVFDRLKDKSFEPGKMSSGLHDVDPNLIPESAKETCQNWLYKMASIRELLPRLYIEMTLLRCYIFLSRNEFDSAIARLTKMIRGIGNPLVATYTRCYLCRVALNVLTQNRDYFKVNLDEFLLIYKQIFLPNIKKDYESQCLTTEMYLSLYNPALDWLLHGALKYSNNSENLIDDLLNLCNNMQNKELFLYCMVSSFDSINVSRKADCILDIIMKSETNIMRHEVLVILGEHLCKLENVNQSASEVLIQSFWKMATNLKSLLQFLRVLEPWMQFASSQLSLRHVNILLRGAIKYITKCGESVDENANIFQSVIKRMLNSVTDVEELFLMDGFMPLLDLIQTSNSKIEISRIVLEIFFRRQTSVSIGDHIIIGNLMRLCCILHDSVNALTVEDEVKLTSDLICKLIQRVTFHDDYEQQLTFYVECRSAFINLDGVLIALVYAVNRLSTKVFAVTNASWLQRACAAYCYITVPSLNCPLTKAQLYLLSGQVALLNNCIGQAEASFKVSISLIPEIPGKIMEDGQMKSTQIKVHALITNFLSTLLVMPDNIEGNTKLYLLSGLLKATEKLQWDRTDSLFYSILISSIDLLCNMAQENYSYHIESVISNDLLYGSDKDFIQAIEKKLSLITEELLVILKQLGNTNQTKKQYSLSLELFFRVVKRGDLTVPSMFTLATNLWMLSQKHQDVDNKLAKSIYLSLQKDKEDNALYKDLLKRMKL